MLLGWVVGPDACISLILQTCGGGEKKPTISNGVIARRTLSNDSTDNKKKPLVARLLDEETDTGRLGRSALSFILRIAGPGGLAVMCA